MTLKPWSASAAWPDSDIDNDFGLIHGKTYCMVDDRGTHWAAYYEGNTWWEGRKGVGPKIQTDRRIVRQCLQES